MTDKEKLINARKEVNTNPSDKQKEAGNYRMGHVNLLGFDITIENPKGSIRRGKDRDGKEWKVKMKYDYGYFTKTLGYDGDAVDVFIGNNLKSDKIFAIDQFLGGKFDETKFMLGFNSKEEAKQGYFSNYEKDWKGFKEITEININDFKQWLYNGKQQRKPFYEYKSLKKYFITEAQRQFIEKQIINESASAKLYHYIDIYNFIDLLKTNTFHPQKTEKNYSNGKNFMSFTRNKNYKEGFPVLAYGEVGTTHNPHCIIRLELDGDRMNRFSNFKTKSGKQHNFNVKPFEWCYHYYGEGGDPMKFADNAGDGSFVSNGKEWMMQSDNDTYNATFDDTLSDVYSHPMSQAEDRLYCDVTKIPNAFSYITRVDIYYNPTNTDEEMEDLFDVLYKLRNPEIKNKIHLYNNFNAFNYQKDTLKENQQLELTAYHGTCHDFNEFERGHEGTGEGGKLYGTGTYVSTLHKVGKFYAGYAYNRNQKNGQQIVYKVEIPEDNGENYLDFERGDTGTLLYKLFMNDYEKAFVNFYLEQFKENPAIYDEKFFALATPEQRAKMFANNEVYKMRDLRIVDSYSHYCNVLGDDFVQKKLMEHGFIGIKAFTGSYTNYRIGEGRNYIIWDPSNIKIINKEYINDDNTLNESSRKKVRKNDKGEIVPDVCPECGSKVGLYIHGEPVYLCSNKKCNKYFGTMPCNLKESKQRKIFLTEKQIKNLKESFFQNNIISLEDSIKNIHNSYNDPDGVGLFGKYYGYRDRMGTSVTIPFFKCDMPLYGDTFLIGEPFTSHNLIRNKIIQSYLDNEESETLKRLFKCKQGKISDLVGGIRDYMFDHENNGRFFIIKSPIDGTNICVFAFWSIENNEEQVNNNNIRAYINQVIEKYPSINECSVILIANGTQPYIVFKQDEDTEISISDNSSQKILHNMPAKEKWKQTQAFRDEKERLLGDKLAKRDAEGNKTGEEMPLAQYNALRYIAEETDFQRHQKYDFNDWLNKIKEKYDSRHYRVFEYKGFQCITYSAEGRGFGVKIFKNNILVCERGKVFRPDIILYVKSFIDQELIAKRGL